MVAIEAMALGVPVVSVSVGGLKEIVEDGESGLLVESRSPSEIAEAVIKLSEETLLRKRIIEGALLRAQKVYSVSRMLDKTNLVYNSSVANKS